MLVFLMSAGQRPENPLLLLGQYSDEELDDVSNKAHSDAAVENSSPQNNDEVITMSFTYFIPLYHMALWPHQY